MFSVQPTVLEFQASLSPRELQALELVARGFSHAEIARLLQVSVHTTRSHIKNVYAKLSVHSKSEAVYEAMQLGLLRPPAASVPYHAGGEAARGSTTNRLESGSGSAGLFDRT